MKEYQSHSKLEESLIKGIKIYKQAFERLLYYYDGDFYNESRQEYLDSDNGKEAIIIFLQTAERELENDN